jgi:hypothetical protein
MRTFFGAVALYVLITVLEDPSTLGRWIGAVLQAASH